MIISVVAPAYNAQNTLDVCLQSLLDQTLSRTKYEVIIVDNGSTDKSRDIIRTYPVTYLFEPVPGSYRTRNAGVRIARGDVLAFIDCDCVADRAWLAEGFRYLETSDIVGGAILPSTSHSRHLYLYDKVITSSVRNGSSNNYLAKAGNCFIRRKVFEEVGGFDDTLISGGDSVLSARAAELGYSVAHGSGAIVYHPVDSLGKRLRRCLRVAHGIEAKRIHQQPGQATIKERGTLRSKVSNLTVILVSRVRLLVEARKSGLISAREALVLLSLVVAIQFSTYSAVLAVKSLRFLKKDYIARY